MSSASIDTSAIDDLRICERGGTQNISQINLLSKAHANQPQEQSN